MENGIVDISKYCKKKFFFQRKNTININGEEYFFKNALKNFDNSYKMESIYNDMIVEEMAKEIGIDVVHIEAAQINNKIGTLTKDYRQADFSYINGSIILEEYLNYLEENKLINEYINPTYVIKYPLNDDLRKYLINDMNNLENIWDALNYHFHNYDEDNRLNIVKNIMVELTKRYSLDYLTMQNDRHERNWEIMENAKKNIATLTPLYDNELSFNFMGFIPQMKVENEYCGNVEIEKYLSFSGRENINQFLNIYYYFTPNKLKEIILNIEDKRNISFPYMYKSTLIRNYEMNYNEITNAINKLKIESEDKSHGR